MLDSDFEYLGMTEAARRLGLRTSNAARQFLRRHGVKLIAVNPRAVVVSSSDLSSLVASLQAEALAEPGKRRRGRPSNIARGGAGEVGGAAGPGGIEPTTGEGIEPEPAQEPAGPHR